MTQIFELAALIEDVTVALGRVGPVGRTASPMAAVLGRPVGRRDDTVTQRRRIDGCRRRLPDETRLDNRPGRHFAAAVDVVVVVVVGCLIGRMTLTFDQK